MENNAIKEYQGVKIIYEDNHILVAVKPQNMPSQEDESKDPDILSILKNYLKETYDKPGDAYLGSAVCCFLEVQLDRANTNKPIK